MGGLKSIPSFMGEGQGGGEGRGNIDETNHPLIPCREGRGLREKIGQATGENHDEW
jgi:hypothetical protein